MLLALARARPATSFAVVATKWTDKASRFALRSETNVTIVAATPHREALYGLARVLLAPSLWPEAFGIVATEACLRGMPCVSSDAGGLPEANPVPELVAPAALVHDMLRSELRHGTTLAA